MPCREKLPVENNSMEMLHTGFGNPAQIKGGMLPIPHQNVTLRNIEASSGES